MSFQIKVDLSVESLDELIRRLELYENRLSILSQTFITYSLDYLNKKAVEYVQSTTGDSDWYVLTHNLENSFQKTITPFFGELINTAHYAVYVENGTGVYALSGDGRKDGWVYMDKEGQFHFTTGMKPHRFMYNAFNDYLIGKEYRVIFDRAFKDVMGGVFG